MPWSLDNLPDAVKNLKFTKKQKEFFVKVANSVLNATGDEGRAIASGIIAAKRQRKDFDLEDSQIKSINDFEEEEQKQAEVQSILFSKSKFTKNQATEWLKNHDYKYSDFDETENEYRFRQLEPNFDDYARKEIDDGVILLFGINKKSLDCSLQVKKFNIDLSEENKNECEFSGYASIFNIVDSYNDIILPGAFKKTLENRNVKDIKMLYQHKHDNPIGIFNEIKEDEEGLYIKGILLLDVRQAKEAQILIKSGAVNGLSIGYMAKDFYIDKKSGIRVIKECALREISIVTFPANEESLITNIAHYEYPENEKKTIEDISNINNIRDTESLLKELGLSQKACKYLISKINEFKSQCDVDDENKKECDVPKKNENYNNILKLQNLNLELLKIINNI